MREQSSAKISSTMKRICRRFAFGLAFLLSIASSRAGLLDKLEGAVTNYVATNSVTGTNRSSASTALNGLSQDQLVGGLKQALSNGLQHAVGQLGHADGFLTNLNVKIQMPARLEVVQKTLHSLKQISWRMIL